MSDRGGTIGAAELPITGGSWSPWGPGDGLGTMPGPLRVARGGMFAQAILALLAVLGVWLWAGSAMSARLAGEMAFAALPATLGLVLCRLMWHKGSWVPPLVLTLQAWWAWGALGWLADDSWRGLTQLVLPVLIGISITRPEARAWFALPAQARPGRPKRRPLLPFSLPHAIGWRRDRGQTATEYVGLLAVVTAIIAALVSSGISTQIGQSIAAQICRAVGTTCGTDTATATGDPQADNDTDPGRDWASGQRDSSNDDPRAEHGRGTDDGDGENPQQAAPQEEEDEGCLSGFGALLSCGMDQAKKAPGRAKEFGRGVKDKFTGDYIDGPKELVKGLVNDPKGTAQAALSGTWEEVTRPFQDAKESCDAAGGGLLGNATCGLGWANAAVNYPNMLIASQVADDDVKESIQNGELSRAGGQFLFNGATVALPFLKGGKLLKTIGKTGKNTKPNANGKNDQADDSRKPCRTHSFLPGTLVLLADGSRKPIEQIRPGEKVLATNPVSGLTAPRRVTDTITTEDDKHFTRLTVRTSTGTSTITATDTHPFWSTDQNHWIDAGDIFPGTELRTPAGEYLTVTKVNRYTEQQRTHDLTIKGIHTYYVGVGSKNALVHNNGPCPDPPNKGTEKRKNALASWKSKTYRVGNRGQSFHLDKEAMDHFLKRHHPKYWDGSVKKNQTFFDKDMTVSEVEDVVTKVVNQNRQTLSSKGANSIYSMEGTVNGVRYQVGVNNGRISQLYPKN